MAMIAMVTVQTVITMAPVPDGHHDGPPKMPKPEEMFSKFDKDGDGKLSKEEFMALAEFVHEHMPPPPERPRFAADRGPGPDGPPRGHFEGHFEGRLEGRFVEGNIGPDGPPRFARWRRPRPPLPPSRWSATRSRWRRRPRNASPRRPSGYRRWSGRDGDGPPRGAASWNAMAAAARPLAIAMTTTIVAPHDAIAAMTVKTTKTRP